MNKFLDKLLDIANKIKLIIIKISDTLWILIMAIIIYFSYKSIH